MTDPALHATIPAHLPACIGGIHLLALSESLLVIDKPAGMASTAGKPGKDQAPLLDDVLPQLGMGRRHIPKAVHRLDRDTSGCLILARTPSALKRANAAVEARRMHKQYLALVAGNLSGQSGQIALNLSKTSSRKRGWWMEPDRAGKEAVTYWQGLSCKDGRTLLLLRPITGRTHQLRAHIYFGLGTSILGDPVYQDNRTGHPEADPENPLMLHASHIELRGKGHDAIAATAPLPKRFGKWPEHEAIMTQPA